MSDHKFGVTDARLKEVVGVALDAIIEDLKAPPKPEAPADPIHGIWSPGTGRCGNAMDVLRLVHDLWGEKQTLSGILGGDPQTAEMMNIIMKQLKRQQDGDDWKDGDTSL